MYSLTFKLSYTPKKSGTYPILSFSWDRPPVTFTPSISTCPSSASKSPVIILMVVVFPAPLGPTNP